MAKKKNNIPSGFDDVLGSIYGNAEGTTEVSNIDDMIVTEDRMPFEDDDIENPPVNTEDGNDADHVDPETEDDDSDNEDDIQNPPSDDPNETESEENDDDSEDEYDESQQVTLLFDAVGESLGWNMNEIDDKPTDVEGLVKYLTDIVNENSVPQYADERIQQLDEYVKNGGKFEDFYAIQQKALNLENIDLEDENNQKAVVRELMQHNGYTEEQINKKISRYEDSDMLYEESEDALDRLKQIRQYEAEQAEKEQEEYARIEQERSKQFYDTVTNEINSLTNIRGISVPKEDRKLLFDYIFKVDQTGKSQYTKDFEKNMSKNLIESAYFTMKADALISSAKKNGETSATLKLKKALKYTGKNHTRFNADEKQRSVTDIVSGMF